MSGGWVGGGAFREQSLEQFTTICPLFMGSSSVGGATGQEAELGCRASQKRLHGPLPSSVDTQYVLGFFFLMSCNDMAASSTTITTMYLTIYTIY